jgi:hypothetical protein
MRFQEFENVISSSRMSRYNLACRGNTQKAMTLYRKNLQLSQEMFTVISCFEVALRNKIDRHFVKLKGNDWLLDAANRGGIFQNRNCRFTQISINEAVNKLGTKYQHNKLVAELGFGFWRYMFAAHQFAAGGRTLLQILPAKPVSSPGSQYNHTFIFNQLANINNLRNRIAHHEPICFIPQQSVKSTKFAREHYSMIIQIFQWMGINEVDLLYGLDHITKLCNEIDAV